MADAQTYFNKLYSPTFAFGSILLQDNGYVLFGDSLTPTNRVLSPVKIDLVGNKKWVRPYGVHPLVYSNCKILGYEKGGYILTATVRDSANGSDPTKILVAAFDSSGSAVEEKIIEYASQTVILDAIKSGNDVVVAGATAIFGDERGDFFLTALNDTGKVLFEKGYGEMGFFEECRSIIQTFDGGFVLSGVKETLAGDWDIWVVKTDSIGNMEWEETYGGKFDEFGGFSAESLDSNIVLIYNSDTTEASNSTRLKFHKLDKTDGSILESKDYPSLEDGSFMSKPVVNFDGTITAIGVVKPGGTRVGLVMKLTPNGDMIWEREYFTQQQGSQYIYDIRATSDSGYVFCGQARPKEQTGGLTIGWIVKLDCFGDDSITHYQEGACEIYSNITHYQGGIAEQIQLFPNPATNQINIALPQGAFAQQVQRPRAVLFA